MASLLIRAVGVALLTILLAACSEEPTEVVVGTEADDAAQATDDGDETPAVDEADSDDAEADSMFDAVAEDSAPIAIPGEIKVLGSSMTGVGEWVLILGESSGEECGAVQTLAYSFEGTVVHVYNELGNLPGVRLFPGPYGQDAFVINCEESVERVLLQGSAVMSDSGWPELQDIELYGPDVNAYFDFLSDWTWRGGLFTGRGTSPTGNAIYAFGTETEPIEKYSALIGPTSEIDPTHNVDVSIPGGWTYTQDSWSVTVASDQSSSSVQVRRGELDDSPPLGEGDELVSRDGLTVWVHETGPLEATDWTFLTPDESVRVVRRVPLGDGSGIEIEMFADVADSAVTQDLPWAVLDLVGIYN